MVEAKLKHTDIGLIPEDWEVLKLSEIGNFTKGKGINKSEANTGNIPAIRYGEIYTKHHNVIKRFYSNISEEVASNSKELKKGDLLFAGSGETKQEIGKTVAFVKNIQAFAGGDIVILRPTRKINSILLGYLLNSKKVQNQKSANGQGDAVVHIYANNLKDIQISLPPFSEQQAIAEVLCDTDNWIEGLENLIAKKQHIKKATMQKLLVPKENWEEIPFSNAVWFQEGPGLRNWQFTNSGLKVINVTNLENGYLNLSRTDRYISLKEFEKMYKHFLIDEHDIVVASSGNSYGKVSVVRKQDLPLLMNTSVIRFKPLPKIDYLFLLVFLKSNYFKNQIDLLITGGAQPNFGPAHLNKISIQLPKDIAEQIHIATILSDMDAEIEVLEQKLTKAKQIKQGLMQELLTGRIRLV